MNKNFPNLFIVGAAKAGTTSLWDVLRKHPQIYMPNDMLFKEPNFFVSLPGTTTYNLDYYLSLFKDANGSEKYVGEASTSYLADDNSAKLIHNFNPKSKIIIILRNPTNRAYSLYNWMVAEGYEFASSFERALQLEEHRRFKKIPNFFEPEYYWDYMYFRSGLYYEQVKKYLDLFGKENVLILKFEELMNNFNYKNICDFLEICYYEVRIERKNKAVSAINPKLNFLIRKINNILGKFYNHKTKQKRDFLIYLFQLNKKPYGINEYTKNKLKNLYKNDILKLEKLTELDFKDWLI